MIRLSLPTYEPTRPLRFHVRCIALIDFEDGYVPGEKIYVHVSIYGDAFTGWISNWVWHEVPVTWTEKFHRFEVDVDFDNPAAGGLRGAEGWFTMSSSGKPVGVSDVVITYTEPTMGDAATGVGYFS